MILTKKITLSILSIIGAVCLFLPSLTNRAEATSATSTLAQSKVDVCNGIGGCADKAGETTPQSAVTTAVNLLSLVVATISVVMVIIGGFKYVTSQGDSNGTTSAKNTIIYALVGLVIVAVAQVMVRFVANRVTA